MKHTIITLFILLFQHYAINAQQTPTNYPQIGKPCPEFQLNEVTGYTQKKLTSKDLKGKFVILDFWNRWCVTCVANFPKVNHIQEQFKDSLQMILIGKEDPYIRPLYEKVRKKYQLKLASAFDGKAHAQFGVATVPHLVWIDDHGIVKAITSSGSLTPENIRKFLHHQKIEVAENPNITTSDASETDFKIEKPFLLNGNGGPDSSYTYRSILSPWNNTIGVHFNDYFQVNDRRPNEVLAIGIPIGALYIRAYADTIFMYPIGKPPYTYGTFSYFPILEMKDTSAFQFDYESEKNLYCYNLTVPKGTGKLKMQKMMQNDLANYFGYHANLETRKMPYWALVKAKGYEKLKTKGLPTSSTGDWMTGVKFSNIPISKVIQLLWGMNQEKPPFIDETEISWNIDINIDAIMTDFEDLKRALRKNGLDLVKKEKDMKVLVIGEKE